MLSNVLVSRDLVGMEEEDGGGNGMKDLVRKIMEMAVVPNVSELFPFLQRFDLQGLRKKSMELAIKIRAIWEPIIEERRKKGASLIQQDFLDTLLHNDFTNDRIHQLLMVAYSRILIIPRGLAKIYIYIYLTFLFCVKNRSCLQRARTQVLQQLNGQWRNLLRIQNQWRKLLKSLRE